MNRLERISKNINVSNDFVFKNVFNEPTIFRLTMQEILQQEIAEIVVPVEPQKEFQATPDTKQIILDLLGKDTDGNIFNLEMQRKRLKDDEDGSILEKRSCYYHANLLVRQLNKSQDYQDCKNAYVIFICSFDPFKMGKCIYTVENKFAETNKYPLSQNGSRIYLNTKAKNKRGISKDLKALLEYIENSDDTIAEKNGSELLRLVAERYNKIKGSEEFMAYVIDREEILEEGKEIGREEARLEEKYTNARNLLDLLPDEVIAERLGLPLKEVKALRKDAESSK